MALKCSSLIYLHSTRLIKDILSFKRYSSSSNQSTNRIKIRTKQLVLRCNSHNNLNNLLKKVSTLNS